MYVLNIDFYGFKIMTYSLPKATLNIIVFLLGVFFILGSTENPPAITILGENPITITQGITYEDAGATAEDIEDGVVEVITTGLSTLDTSVVKTYTITYTVTDQDNNTATKTRTVHVVTINTPDTTKPVISIIGNAKVDLIVGDSYTDAGATANDNKDGNISNRIIKIGSVDTATAGIYTIKYSISDVAGNKADEVVRTVTVAPVQNVAPTISGSPKISTNIYNIYQFLPAANDQNNDILTFSIENKPAWAEFNTATGLLQGTPTAKGNSTNIIISVSDDSESVSLAPFSIEVDSAINIAHKFGIATQNSGITYYYYRTPANAIDNDLNTFNMTADAGWLQVALPKGTKVAKVVIRNRTDAWSNRINGTKVYVGTKDFNGAIVPSDEIGTLTSATAPQIFTFDTLKDGDYVLLKENNDNLHVLEVEVYGVTPASPVFKAHKNDYLISGTSTVGTRVATITAIDYQSDILTYSLVGSVPFVVDAEGHVTVSGALNAQTYTFEIGVTDGVNSTRTSITMNVTASSVIADVLASGNVLTTKITEEELIQATLDEIELAKTFLQDAKVKIFNLKDDGTAKGDGSSLTSIDWTPTHDASIILPTLGTNSAFLYTNAVESQSYTIYKKEIGTLGGKGNARYMVFGSNPFRNAINSDMNKVLENSVAWLTGRDDLKANTFNVVLAHLDESHYFRDESKTRAWLDAHYAGQVHYNNENACDGTALASCLDASTNLLIISQISASSDNVENIVATVNQALSNGISVLYIHHDGNLKSLGKELFSSVFSVNYQWDNYWKKLKVEAYNPTVDINILPESLAKVKTMFTHFKNKDYSFDWGQCKDSKGVYGINNDNCSEVVGLNSEFQYGAVIVKNIINAFDNIKKNIFTEEGYKLQKLLVLTADKFRQSVVYPMDKVTTDDNAFMQSFYSDHAIYNYRTVNPKQPNMGNFSRSDFSHITPITKTVNLTSKKSFRSTSAYALPGQTVKVTRTDSSDLTVKVFINTLRSGATHQYQKNKYNRPKYLQTPHFEIKSGESIELTSPYGGTLQLEFSKNDLPVAVKFENVGEHAYWASPADNASFAQKLTANEYEWAEVATAGFEVHSKLDKMVQSVADTKWGGTAEGLANAVNKYTSNYPHVLAGFKGNGVDVVLEIHSWADGKGLTIETIDTMKHMNADQAACGYGCSGNPYDAYWAFNPIGHGDIHEMGHSLQKMRFEGFPNHAATNTFSYYTKSRYTANTGDTNNECWGMPFKTIYQTIQSSVGNADIEAFLKTNLWDTAGLGEQYILKIQAMMHAQKMGKVENGWHVLARVHILEREMRRAKADWDARKASVGFDTYTLDEINAIGNNDWLIVAYSYAAGLDYRNYFDMMGIPFSDKARAQIASFGYDVVPNALFQSEDTAYCSSANLMDQPLIAVDGTTTWP